jgi:hypothetical protein
MTRGRLTTDRICSKKEVVLDREHVRHELPESIRNVACEHHCFGGCAKDSNAVFGYADAGMLILGTHEVIRMMCLEEGGEFFVENLGTLIRA